MYQSFPSLVSIACSREVIDWLLGSVFARFKIILCPEYEIGEYSVFSRDHGIGFSERKYVFLISD